MREFLKTKGFKMTPQREIIFRAFFEIGDHVTVDELYRRVRKSDNSVGYSTVWRNLKLICRVGLAEEVNLGDGVTRYDRVTREPHGHFYCVQCKQVTEFEMEEIVAKLHPIADKQLFHVDTIKCEISGVCETCQKKTDDDDDTPLVS